MLRRPWTERRRGQGPLTSRPGRFSATTIGVFGSPRFLIIDADDRATQGSDPTPARIYTSASQSHQRSANPDTRTSTARAPYYLVGTPGDDYLFTGPANDTLIGGRGNDYLAGDLGDDTYVFNVGDGADQIFDYGGNDTLRFGRTRVGRLMRQYLNLDASTVRDRINVKRQASSEQLEGVRPMSDAESRGALATRHRNDAARASRGSERERP